MWAETLSRWWRNGAGSDCRLREDLFSIRKTRNEASDVAGHVEEAFPIWRIQLVDVGISGRDQRIPFAASFDYLMMFGTLVGGWQMACAAGAAAQRLDGGRGDARFNREKLATHDATFPDSAACAWFFCPDTVWCRSGGRSRRYCFLIFSLGSLVRYRPDVLVVRVPQPINLGESGERNSERRGQFVLSEN
ncbi:MAG: hypothetical protein CM1200mP41_22270 [Gammaproteobacteria bacterium]|nr:MAG: hypothetical protein CM1200mP41_22270 [Gammaproteobacteria bacterium]